MQEKVGVWCENIFQVYSAKPIVEKYRKDHQVVFFTKRNNIKFASEYCELDATHFIDIDNIKKRRHTLLMFFFSVVFVNINFSFVYRKAYIGNEKLWKRVLRATFRLFNAKNEKVNTLFLKYRKFLEATKIIPKVDLSVDKLVSFTKVNYPFLIPTNVRSHISIMESWDHPMKFPYFIMPDVHMVWNRDLANDAKKFQNMRNVQQIYPLKFRYLYDRRESEIIELEGQVISEEYKEELAVLKEKKILLYPTTTSSAGIEHEGELKIIDDLCEVVKGTDYTLYIKPKPNGPQGDYDEFKDRENVMVGAYASNPNSYDMLNEEYHTFRYLLLKFSDVVINTGTTFVLEAAVVDRPVIQLDVQTDRFGGFTEFVHTYHLDNYIVKEGAVPFNGNIDEVRGCLESVSMDYSIFLKNWLTRW